MVSSRCQRHVQICRAALAQDAPLQAAAGAAAVAAQGAAHADATHASAQAALDALVEERLGAEERASRAGRAVEGADAGLAAAGARKAAADAALQVLPRICWAVL